ncbi:MAG TPA: hypothetical protein VMH81_06105 [Bryobacteraceae bacterium]|nr:hypothetical protein [Bryobacteraceae bacterium]
MELTILNAPKPKFIPHEKISRNTPILSELCLLAEVALLRFSPAYYGFGVPRGDGSAVVLIPGLVCLDAMLFELHRWLERIGYQPYYSGFGLTADCPNELARILGDVIDRASAETGGRRVHLIGHSLGGVFARREATLRVEQIASVITLGTPFRGHVAHPLLFEIGEWLQQAIRERRKDVSPLCASTMCGCEFGRSLQNRFPESVRQTSIYSRNDGLVGWHYCLTGIEGVDVEAHGTHLGMPFSAEVYEIIARRLAEAKQ